jgi:hypothetical protein
MYACIYDDDLSSYAIDKYMYIYVYMYIYDDDLSSYASSNQRSIGGIYTYI